MFRRGQTKYNTSDGDYRGIHHSNIIYMKQKKKQISTKIGKKKHAMHLA